MDNELLLSFRRCKRLRLGLLADCPPLHVARHHLASGRVYGLLDQSGDSNGRVVLHCVAGQLEGWWGHRWVSLLWVSSGGAVTTLTFTVTPQSIWSSSMMQPGPSALEQLLLQQKQKQQRGHGAMNPPH